MGINITLESGFSNLVIGLFKELIDFMCKGGAYGDIRAFFTDSLALFLNNDYAQSIYGWLKGIAFGILVIYLYIDIYDHYLAGRFNIDMLVKTIIRGLLSYLLLANVLEIVNALVGLGDEFVNTFSGELSSFMEADIGPGLAVIQKYIENLPQSTVTITFIKLIIPLYIMIVTKFMLLIAVLSRSVELVARAVLAPLAVPKLYGGNDRNSAIRYLKKLAAVSVQAATTLAIIWASSIAFRVYMTQPTPNDLDPANGIYLDEGGNLHSVLDVDSSGATITDNIGKLKKLSPAVTYALMQNPEQLTKWATASANAAANGEYDIPKVVDADEDFDEEAYKEIFTGDNATTYTNGFVGKHLFNAITSFKTILAFCVVQLTTAGAAIKAGALAEDIIGV